MCRCCCRSDPAKRHHGDGDELYDDCCTHFHALFMNRILPLLFFLIPFSFFSKYIFFSLISFHGFSALLYFYCKQKEIRQRERRTRQHEKYIDWAPRRKAVSCCVQTSIGRDHLLLAESMMMTASSFVLGAPQHPSLRSISTRQYGKPTAAMNLDKRPVPLLF